MNWISARTPGFLLWMWPRLIVLIVSSPLRIALADRREINPMTLFGHHRFQVTIANP